MTTDEIQTILLAVLREIQRLRGRSWKDLKPDSRPIGSLEAFDSLVAVEATVMVEERLGCGDLQVESIFVSEDGRRALSVREIAMRIARRLATVGENT